jgi:hypothetical protein
MKICSFMSIFKIILTFVAGLQHHVPINNNLAATGDSFLMSIASLGMKV